jgi:transposase InsO family protein
MAYRRDFKDIEDVREAVFKYIELFYNRKRLCMLPHSSLGHMTPVEYRLKKEAA